MRTAFRVVRRPLQDLATESADDCVAYVNRPERAGGRFIQAASTGSGSD
jgi:hypothetical protein